MNENRIYELSERVRFMPNPEHTALVMNTMSALAVTHGFVNLYSVFESELPSAQMREKAVVMLMASNMFSLMKMEISTLEMEFIRNVFNEDATLVFDQILIHFTLQD